MPASESNEGNWPSNTFCQKKKCGKETLGFKGVSFYSSCAEKVHIFCSTAKPKHLPIKFLICLDSNYIGLFFNI